MRRKSWLSIAMAALGASLLMAAGFANPADSSTAQASSGEVKRGGTIRVNIPGGDIDDIDPSIAYGTTTWAMQYITALKLLNYPDAPAPRGSRLIPEGATGFTVSNNGKTYTFKIRKGFRFSDGRPVTAANYAYAINRSLDRDLQAPGFQFISDPSGSNIVGAQDVRDAKAPKAKGVRSLRNGSVLQITLTRPDPTFLAKITMPFFQAMNTRIPRGKKVISVQTRTDLPSAGPYYVAFREPNRQVVIRRNPFYKGSRARNPDAIEYRVGVNLEAGYRQLLAGEVDYQEGLPSTAHAELGRDHGVNRGRYRVEPANCTAYLAMNTSKGVFQNNTRLRQAVNFAINRDVMVAQYGAYGGRPHDQILPPGFPGFQNANIYPATPNASRARSLASGQTRGGKVVMFHGLTAPGPQVMEIVRANLKEIGLDIEPRGFRGFAIYDAAGKRGSDHDLTTGGWCQDYPDPYNFINVLLYGGNIQDENNNNLAYFNTPTYNRKMEQASRLLGDARLKTYGALDIDISKNQAPWASWRVPNDRLFFGQRVDMRSFVFQPVYENVVFNRLALK